MKDLKEILKDPSAAFTDPCEVLVQSRLDSDDKARILRQWRYDLVQLQVASDENLVGDGEGSARIKKIDECLRQLGAAAD